MVSNNEPLDLDRMTLPISQLVEILLAWRQVNQVSPKTLDESR
jgi:hypothetical protein